MTCGHTNNKIDFFLQYLSLCYTVDYIILKYFSFYLKLCLKILLDFSFYKIIIYINHYLFIYILSYKKFPFFSFNIFVKSSEYFIKRIHSIYNIWLATYKIYALSLYVIGAGKYLLV